MRILLPVSLLLLITIIHPVSYKDNQTDIYIKEYTGEIVNSGNLSYQASRIVIGVKERVTKQEVEEIAKNIDGEISGWAIVPNLYDSYTIDVPADKLESVIIEIKSNPQVAYAIRNYVDEKIDKRYAPNNDFSSPYYGEKIQDNYKIEGGYENNYFQANSILLVTKKSTSTKEIDGIVSPYGGKIFGTINGLNAYSIFLPADQRELALAELGKNPKIDYLERNYYFSSNNIGNEGDYYENEKNMISRVASEILLKLIFLATVLAILLFLYKKYLNKK